MPKIEANSVNYNSIIGSDFKNVASSRKGPRHHSPLIISIAASLIGVIIVSVVLAHSNQSTLAKVNLSNTAVNSTAKEIPLAQKTVADRIENQVIWIAEKPTALSVATFAAEELALAAKEIQAIPVVTPSEEVTRVTIEVKKGDTLSSIFSELDIHTELTRLLNLGKDAKPFKKIYPGQKLHFLFGASGLNTIELEKSITKSLFLYRNDESFIVEEAHRELNKISQVATGTINNSLFLAGQNAGMSDGLIMDLAGIFGWDIDFALDIRKGDNFTVLYEELYLEGEKVRDGNIISAEFINNGRQYRAFRYTDSHEKTEYYSPDGKSMRKPFLRTPVNLARISSYFNLRRKHPILNKIRAHKGVDYAASTGTPIMASGDGKVVHRGKKGGYGNTVILRHGNTYTTLYAHMSKYAKSTGVGSSVRQAQIIGYIGSSGLATGPHLHYEFRVNGVHRNPLKVKLPSAKPLPDSEMDRFQASIQPLVVQLDAYTQNALVMRDL